MSYNICRYCGSNKDEWRKKIYELVDKYNATSLLNPGGRTFEFEFGRCHTFGYCYKEDYETLISFLEKHGKL